MSLIVKEIFLRVNLCCTPRMTALHLSQSNSLKCFPEVLLLTFRRHLIALAVLCALGIVAYSGTLHNGFVWDDNFQLVRNPYMHADQPWKPLLQGDAWSYMRGGQAQLSNYYRPLQFVSYRLVAQAAGMQPGAFHAVSVAFNILASFAAYLLLARLTGSFGIGLAGAVLFAVRPEHSEAVAWIAALPELGCALCFFLAF